MRHPFEGLNDKSTKDDKIIALFNAYNDISNNAFKVLQDKDYDSGYIGEYAELLDKKAKLGLDALQKQRGDGETITPQDFIVDALNSKIIDEKTAKDLLSLDQDIFPKDHALIGYLAAKQIYSAIKEGHEIDGSRDINKFKGAILQEVNKNPGIKTIEKINPGISKKCEDIMMKRVEDIFNEKSKPRLR